MNKDRDVWWSGLGLLAMALLLVMLVHPLMAQVHGVTIRYGDPTTKVVRTK